MSAYDFHAASGLVRASTINSGIADAPPPNTLDGGEIADAISSIYNADQRVVLSLSIAGGGAQLFPMLYSVPGASRCLMDSQIPYARSALQAMTSASLRADEGCFTGAVDSSTSVSMARASYRRALSLFLAETRDASALRGANVLGLACTAALASALPKKGEHRCHVACVSSKGVRTYDLIMQKGHRSRRQEDELCSRILLDALMDNTCLAGVDLAQRIPSEVLFPFSGSWLTSEERIIVHHEQAVDSLDNLFSGTAKQVLFVPKDIAMLKKSVHGVGTDRDDGMDLFDCFQDAQLPSGSIVYPGSFRPLHRGHVQLSELVVASVHSREGVQPMLVFEISVMNADKPPLSRAEILSRVHSLLVDLPSLCTPGCSSSISAAICITTAPMFLEKANIFRGCTFVLGADTMVRMLNPKYYADAKELTASGLSPEQVAVAQSMALVAALATIAERGIRFVVGGRHCAGMRAGTGTEDVDGFLTCSQILVSPAACVLPLALRHMFAEVEESAFRVDLSSSQIRKEKQKAQEQDQEQMNIGKKD